MDKPATLTMQYNSLLSVLSCLYRQQQTLEHLCLKRTLATQTMFISIPETQLLWHDVRCNDTVGEIYEVCVWDVLITSFLIHVFITLRPDLLRLSTGLCQSIHPSVLSHIFEALLHFYSSRPISRLILHLGWTALSFYILHWGRLTVVIQ